ncbi:hypothetical protein MTR07_12060 [Staphylococcus agnetis]|nr:hypothetical protein [Staphylococcus agnetis]
MSLIKRNIMTPSVVTALKLSKVFSINVEELFLLEDKD